MATASVFDVYTIPSSSPSRPFHATVTMSSSPLPSPSKVCTRRPAVISTGSRAATIPSNALGFTSAPTLLKNTAPDDLPHTIRLLEADSANSEGRNQGESTATKPTKLKRVPKTVKEKLAHLAGGKSTEVVDNVVGGDTQIRKERKPRAKKRAANPSAELEQLRLAPQSRPTRTDVELILEKPTKEKATRKPRAKKSDQEGGAEPVVPKEKTVRKPRAKKSDEQTNQTKLATGRVTKTTSSKSQKLDSGKTKRSETISKHFVTLDNEIATCAEIPDEGLNLEDAVKRRTTWTPPTDTRKILPVITPLSSDLLGGDQSSRISPNTEQKTKNFGDLLSGFEFKNTDGSMAEKRLSDSSGTRKRKLIELVTTNTSMTTTTTPIAKSKAVKKKPKTITEQATSAYVVEEAGVESAQPAPLLHYFSHQSNSGSQSEDGFKVPSKPRSKISAEKATSRPTKSMQETAAAPILLSPSSALKQVDAQEFVFGTSSQLAREESPTFLRDLQEALQASNQVDAETFGEDPFEDLLLESSAAATFLKCGVQAASGEHSLWSAAKRDDSGELLEIETLDLVNSPPASMNKTYSEDGSAGKLPRLGDEKANPIGLADSHSAKECVEDGSMLIPTHFEEGDFWHKLVSTNLSLRKLPQCARDTDDTSIEVETNEANSSEDRDVMTALPYPGDDIWHDLDSEGPSPKRFLQAPQKSTAVVRGDENLRNLDDAQLCVHTVSSRSRLEALESNLEYLPQKPHITMSQVGPVKAATRLQLKSPNKSSTTGKAAQTKSVSCPEKVARKRNVKSIEMTSEMPDFSAYSDAQLAKAFAVYQFKATKKRSVMIAKLEESWEGNQRQKLGILDSNALVRVSKIAERPLTQAPEIDSTYPPKKARGRPRKDVTGLQGGSTVIGQKKCPTEMRGGNSSNLHQTPKKGQTKSIHILDEISDSDTPMTPSPPRRSTSQIKAAPQPLQLSTSIDTGDSPALSPVSLQNHLFKHIYYAIKTDPRTNDPLRPSWREKVQLYDPIILEDLTAWLNTGALEKVGWDGEIAPAEVKKFCESKSICCLWKENLRGGARSRY